VSVDLKLLIKLSQRMDHIHMHRGLKSVFTQIKNKNQRFASTTFIVLLGTGAFKSLKKYNKSCSCNSGTIIKVFKSHFQFFILG